MNNKSIPYVDTHIFDMDDMYRLLKCKLNKEYGLSAYKEVNKMNKWLVVHSDLDGSPAIILKNSITYVGTDEDGGTVIHANNFIYLISEKYTDIVRRIVNEK